MKELFKISLSEDNNVQTEIRIRNREEYDIISSAFLEMLEDFTKEYKGDLRKKPIQVHPALIGYYIEQNEIESPTDAKPKREAPSDTDPLVIPLSIKSSGPKS